MIKETTIFIPIVNTMGLRNSGFDFDLRLKTVNRTRWKCHQT